MAIDTVRIQSLVDELGLEGADKEYFLKTLTTNEKAATQFAGQRERHDRFTQLTQDLSQRGKELEKKVNDNVTAYAQQLSEANKRIEKILTEFESEKISRATAEARLHKVKEKYSLTDDEIPNVEVPTRSNPNPNKDAGVDIDAKLTKFKSDLLRELMPELVALPRVAATINEIQAQHLELTGKRMTKKETEELMGMTQTENGPNLMQAWEEKYGIPQIREDKRFEVRLAAKQTEWEDNLKRKTSEEAMRGVRPMADNQKAFSPVLGRQYQQHKESADRFQPPAPAPTTPPPQQQNIGGPKPSGAERAAAKFMERRAQGIPMGKEAPVGSNQ